MDGPKRSSTSSSDAPPETAADRREKRGGTRHARTMPLLQGVAVFVVSLIGIGALGEAAVRSSAVQLAMRESVRNLSLPDEPAYLCFNRSPMDQDVLYHNLWNTIAPARRADVLFLGNSYAMFALDPTALRPFFDRAGLRPFLLGFGCGETDVLPRAIIERYDLRPPLVVVNVDEFFTGKPSILAVEARRRPRFEAWRETMERRIGWGWRRRWHGIAPYWPEALFRTHELLMYRATRDGAWLPARISTLRALIPPDERTEPLVLEEELERAKRFQEWLRRRGGEMIVMVAPKGATTVVDGRRWGELLGVPFLEVSFDGLVTWDGGHLAGDSPARFTERLCDRLAECPPFHQLAARITEPAQ